MEGSQVGLNWEGVELWFELMQKVGDASLKFTRICSWIWFPFGTDEELLSIPGFIIHMGNKHICAKVANEAGA